MVSFRFSGFFTPPKNMLMSGFATLNSSLCECVCTVLCDGPLSHAGCIFFVCSRLQIDCDQLIPTFDVLDVAVGLYPYCSSLAG